MSWVLAKHAAPVSILSWGFLALGLALFGLAGLGWSNHLSDEGVVVANNVLLAAEPIEGMTSAQVAALVEARASQLLESDLTIDYGGSDLVVQYGDIGFSYDQDATAGVIMATRHEGSPWNQFAAWVFGELVPAEIEEVWGFDPEQARAALDDHPGLTPIVVTEPVISPDGSGSMVVTPGVVGAEADIADIVRQLETVVLVAPPSSIETEVEEILPTVSDEEAEAEAGRLNDLTGKGVVISVEGRVATVPAPAVQSLLLVEVADDRISARFDEDGLQRRLESTIVGPVGAFVEPVLNVGEDDEIEVVTPGEVPPICCQPDSGEWLGQQILKGVDGPFRLSSRPADDPQLVAWADGSAIVEKVGEFTTPHACCEARVQNIQRIADIVRGIYLVPGETLSLNEFVGPRTVDNGFVPAGAIRSGHLIQEVGGGVSQFATTIFNAAFFAGLDIPSYYMHGIYISRYPFGRESTISFPEPDVKIRNNTPYGVLIWPTYTGTSITVTMYSTKHVSGEQTAQSTEKKGICTAVTTERTRTYVDGRKTVDRFSGLYSPEEGVKCE